TEVEEATGVNSKDSQVQDEAILSDDSADWVSENSSKSTVIEEAEKRFNAGGLAVRFVLLLICAYLGVRVYLVYRLVRLMHTLRRMLDTLRPALGDEATGTLVDRRVRTGAVSSDAVLSISGSFGCNLSHIVSCWELDEANMTRVSRGFYLPIRQHLQQAHLPESFSQMLMILVSFLVTHLIRGRGIWEVDHRLLLQQNELIRLNEQRLVEQRRSAGLVINAQNTDSRADGWRQPLRICYSSHQDAYSVQLASAKITSAGCIESFVDDSRGWQTAVDRQEEAVHCDSLAGETQTERLRSPIRRRCRRLRKSTVVWTVGDIRDGNFGSTAAAIDSNDVELWIDRLAMNRPATTQLLCDNFETLRSSQPIRFCQLCFVHLSFLIDVPAEAVFEAEIAEEGALHSGGLLG
uniref:Piezo_RRas_bdg domain-containing protein n=1 Tax=Macrostomum lignano TaxID=282301 RepID=A0A1I8HWP4_9PLAT